MCDQVPVRLAAMNRAKGLVDVQGVRSFDDAAEFVSAALGDRVLVVISMYAPARSLLIAVA